VFAVDRPTAPLPRVHAEARRVGEALERLGHPVSVIVAEAVTRSEVVAQLEDPETALMHFAGHAVAVSAGDGWESQLVLADGALTAADILALRRVPEQVVLSACSGARGSGSTHGGLGVAQAFALAGSRRVVAATEDVEDAAAEAAMKSIYALSTKAGADGRWRLGPGVAEFRTLERW
jgi:CHAT domain-containing protein